MTEPLFDIAVGAASFFAGVLGALISGIVFAVLVISFFW